MPVAEVNDVDISKLFQWKVKFEIVDDEDNVIQEVYMRVLGDADLNRTRVYALRRSAELRKNLRDPESDYHFAYISDIDDIDTTTMVNVITLLSTRDVSKSADNEVKLKLPTKPKSDASTEELEKYQAKIDEYPRKRFELVKEKIDKNLDSLKKRLSTLSKEELYKEYEKRVIDELCEQELLNGFRDRAAQLSAYRDEELSELVFSDVDDFINLPKEIKDQFIAAYESLELYGDNLKKLQRATP